MRLANLALKFVLELAAFAAYAWSSFVLVGHPVWSWVAAVVMTGVVLAVWGSLIAPNAPRRLPLRLRIVAEVAVYAGAVFLLTLAGLVPVAIVLAALVAVNEVLLIRWGQYEAVDNAVAERRREVRPGARGR